MKNARVLVIVAAFALSPAAIGQQPNESADQQLKAAMHRELVGGDLRAAIKEYENIVSRYRDNRAVVARALLQIAQCYDKLGQADARKVYEQIVRQYADQAEPAAQARARLAAMDPPPPPRTTGAPGVARLLPRIGVGANRILSLSADGVKTALVDYTAGGMNLAVYDANTSEVKLLTSFAPRGPFVLDLWAAWSRDGGRVAFTQLGGESVELRVTTLSGEPRTLFRNDANPGRLVLPADWLPDGRSLVTVLERADRSMAIGLLRVSGGEFVPLRSLLWSGGYPDRPRASPDGRFIVYSDGAAGASDIHLIGVDGRTAVQLTDHPAADFSPIWSPDGRHIAFLSSRLGSAALWVLPIKDGRPAGNPVRVKEGMQAALLADWISKGLVYDELIRTSDIYTVALDSGQPAGPTRQLAFARTGRNTAPVWSPDGRQIAFVSGSATEPDRRFVVVLPEKSGAPREFLIPTMQWAPGGLEPYDLRWFGDGRGLGFSGTGPDGQRKLFQLFLATGEWQTIPSPSASQTRIEWDHSGHRVFFVDRRVGIVERDLTTHESRIVSRHGEALVRGLRLSPDRRSLAFTVAATPNPPSPLRLMVVNLESGQARTILEAERSATQAVSLGVPAWSPDGRALIITRTHGARRSWPELLVVPVDGGPTRTVVLNSDFVQNARSSEDFGVPFGDIVWSPDGKGLTFALSVTRRATWLIESVLSAPASAATRNSRSGGGR